MGNQISPSSNKINYDDIKNHPFTKYIVDTLLNMEFHGIKKYNKKRLLCLANNNKNNKNEVSISIPIANLDKYYNNEQEIIEKDKDISKLIESYTSLIITVKDPISLFKDEIDKDENDFLKSCDTFYNNFCDNVYEDNKKIFGDNSINNSYILAPNDQNVNNYKIYGIANWASDCNCINSQMNKGFRNDDQKKVCKSTTDLCDPFHLDSYCQNGNSNKIIYNFPTKSYYTYEIIQSAEKNINYNIQHLTCQQLIDIQGVNIESLKGNADLNQKINMDCKNFIDTNNNSSSSNSSLNNTTDISNGNSPTNNSPTNNSPTNNSPTNNSPTNNSPTNNSPTNNSPTNNSPTTGNSINILIFIIISLVVLVLIISGIVYLYKNKNNIKKI
jgi:hypothetical protein